MGIVGATRTAAASGRARTARVVRAVVPAWPGRRRPRGRDVVLLYHRVLPGAEADPLGMVVPLPLFLSQLEAVQESYDVVEARELARPGGRRPRAALTFDDGYVDNAEVVAPLLVALKLPATYFVTTDPLTARGPAPPEEFWWDRLEHLLAGLRGRRPKVGLDRRPLELDLTTADGRAAAAKVLNRRLARRPPQVVEAVLEQLRAAGGSDLPCDRHRRLSVEQLAELAARPGVEIGSHTCSHAPLGRLDPVDSRAELTRSRTALADVLGAPPAAVAYPYGAPGTLRRRDARAAAAAGYERGYVNVPGPVEGAPPHLVPRITVPAEEPDALLRRLATWDGR